MLTETCLAKDRRSIGISLLYHSVLELDKKGLISMSAWMKKLHWKRILLSGFWYTVIAEIVMQVEIFFTMKYYQDPALFGLWSKLMMPNAGPPPLTFFAISLLFMYATGCTLAAVFEFISSLFGKSYWSKVVGFTDIMVGLAIIFASFPMYLLFNVPITLLAWWLGTNWVTILLASMVFARR